MEQIFLNESLKFYVRCKSERPQMIYANINVAGNRIVISTGAKVLPNQFSVKKQTAVVSNLLSVLDCNNNRIANEVIADFKSKFSTYMNFLVNNPDRISDIRTDIYNFVGMKRKVKENKFEKSLEYILKKELEEELKDKQISESRYAVKVSAIGIFLDFMKENNILMDWSSMTLQTYRKYVDYLVNKAKNVTTINSYLSSLKSVINGITDKEIMPSVDTHRWKLVKKQISTSEKKSSNYMFSDVQLQKIIDLNLSGELAVVRDLFVFACNVGQRPADCCRLLRGEGKRFVSNGIEVLQLLPHKTRLTDKPAIVPLFNVEDVDAIMNRFKTESIYIDYLNKTDVQRNGINSRRMKQLFSKAGIEDEFVRTIQKGNEVVEETTNQTDKSHMYLSRHYFITLMCRNNVPETEVIKMTGHSTTKQVSETYTHLNIQQQADNLTSNEMIQRMAGNKEDDDETTLDELKELILSQNRKNPLLEALEKFKEEKPLDIQLNHKLNK